MHWWGGGVGLRGWVSGRWGVGWVLVAAAGAAVHAAPASKAAQKAMVHLPSPQVAALKKGWHVCEHI